MTDSRPWADKVAVITGAASGIGEATAAEFAARGAKVAILDRAVVKSSSKSNHHLYLACDVSSVSGVEAAAARIFTEFGPVSFLVNSAGIQRYGTGTTTSDEIWDLVMAVNVKSMF